MENESLEEEQEDKDFLKESSEKEKEEVSHHEKVARVIEQSRVEKRKSKISRKKFKVLTILCPYKDCQRALQLLCPYCKAGALECDDHTLAMVCHNCHNTLHHLPCPHCRFIIKSSYIYDRQSHMKEIVAKADESKFIATITTFVLVLGLAWLIVFLGS